MTKNNFLEKFRKIIWILTPFVLITVILMLLFRCCNDECLDCNQLQEKINSIEQKIKDKDCLDCNWDDTLDIENDTIIDGETVYKPTDNCRAHFSGLLMSDIYEKDWKSEAWIIDYASEYVGEGEYPRGWMSVPKSHKQTFDGIAIGNGTRVIIYEKPDFKGNILLDKSGPIIITNKLRLEQDKKMSSIVEENNSKKFKSDLEKIFPPNKRIMSSSNMFDWSKGSLKVICNE